MFLLTLVCNTSKTQYQEINIVTSDQLVSHNHAIRPVYRIHTTRGLNIIKYQVLH